MYPTSLHCDSIAHFTSFDSTAITKEGKWVREFWIGFGYGYWARTGDGFGNEED